MSRDPSTALGGERIDFSATAWSQLILRPEMTPAERERNLEALARRYWKPIYQYIRARWQKSNEDAKDLTQQFFLWMLDTDFLRKAREDRGRFRNFVKKSVERFVLGENDARQRLKRGGSHRHISLTFIEKLGGDLPSPTQDPETVLTDQWRRVLIEEALARLEASYRAQGKEAQYAVFESFYLAPEPGPSHEELARRHNLSIANVNNYLSRARARFRAVLEGLIADGVRSSADLEQEFRELFGDAP